MTSNDAQLPTVTVTVYDPDSPEEHGGMCFAEYTIELTIGDDLGVDLSGFLACGWMQGQPPGWISVPHVRPKLWDDPDEHNDPDDTIIIIDGVNYADEIMSRMHKAPVVHLTPDDVPVWRAALRAARDDDSALERAAEIRASLVEAISDALKSYSVPDAPEPTSEQVYEDLPEGDWPGIRLGDWRGAGIVLAWSTGDGDYDHRYWPDEDDVADAKLNVAAQLAADTSKAGLEQEGTK
jgi:hypothetical protein